MYYVVVLMKYYIRRYSDIIIIDNISEKNLIECINSI